MVVSRGVPDGRDARAPLNPKKFSRRRAWPGTGHREGGITHVDVIIGPLAEQLDVGDFRHVSRCSCAGKRATERGLPGGRDEAFRRWDFFARGAGLLGSYFQIMLTEPPYSIRIIHYL